MFRKLIRRNRTKISRNDDLDIHSLPEYITIIMDENGRWAKKHKMPRTEGHYKDMQTIKKVTCQASHLGIRYLALYAFSTEDWSRPESEVSYIMNLPVNFLKAFLPELIEKNVKIEAIGFLDAVPQSTIEAINYAKEKTKNNTGLKLVSAINYSRRAEFVQSMKSVYDELQRNGQNSDDTDELMISRHLMTHPYPNPDLLIRTSGERRLSNFLIWQTSCSEFIFSEKLWPDFDGEELKQCIKIYQSRQRCFGGLSEG